MNYKQNRGKCISKTIKIKYALTKCISKCLVVKISKYNANQLNFEEVEPQQTLNNYHHKISNNSLPKLRKITGVEHQQQLD